MVSSSTIKPAAALTTQFAPSPSCLTDLYLSEIPGSYWFELGPALTAASTDCFPSGWNPTATFSPGLSCPNGYSTACKSVFSIGTATETIATCCPNGYKCYTDAKPWFTGELCTSQVASSGTVIVTTTTAIGLTTTAVLVSKADGVNAYGLVLAAQATDLNPPTSSPPSSTSSPTSTNASVVSAVQTTSSSSTTTTSAPSSTAPPSASTGLSPGAKAGIGVGVSLGALLILTLAFLFFHYRRRNPARRDSGEQALAAGDGGPMVHSPVSGYGAVMQDERGGGGLETGMTEQQKLDAYARNVPVVVEPEAPSELPGDGVGVR